MAAAQEAILPHVIEALWSASVLDIQITIRHAVSKLLHDSSVSHEARVKRAYGLKYLGTIFRTVAPCEDAQTSDARAQIEAAMRAALFKSQNGREEGGEPASNAEDNRDGSRAASDSF